MRKYAYQTPKCSQFAAKFIVHKKTNSELRIIFLSPFFYLFSNCFCYWNFTSGISELHLTQEMEVISFTDACNLSMLFNLSCSTQRPLVVGKSHFRSSSICRGLHLVVHSGTRIPCSSSSSTHLRIPVWTVPISMYWLSNINYIYTCWWLVRVTLVVAWWFFAPKFWEVAGTYESSFFPKVHAPWAVVTMWGGGDTKTLSIIT